MGRLNDTLEAIWDALKRDPQFQAHTRYGTLFEFDDTGALKSLRFKPVECPIVAIYPAGAWAVPEVSSKPMQHWRAPFHIELATAGREADKILTLFNQLHAALQAAWDDGGGLLRKVRSSYGLHAIHFADVVSEALEEESARLMLWRMSCTLVCTFALTA